MLLCCQNWQTGYVNAIMIKRTALIYKGCPLAFSVRDIQT